MAVKTIEDVAAVGIDHLIDKNIAEKRKGLNCCVGCCAKLLLSLVFVAMMVFTALYWVKRTVVEDQYSDANSDVVIDDSINDAPVDNGSA